MASNRRNREGGKSVQDFAPQILTQTKTEPNRFKENGRAKIDAFAATRQANRRRVVSLPMKPQENKTPCGFKRSANLTARRKEAPKGECPQGRLQYSA